MELDAIKNSWKQENLQIAANVQLNKSALMDKINKETSWMKKKNLLVLLFRIPFPVIILILLFTNIQIRNIFKLRKLDLTESYLDNKKKVSELELFKLKMTKRNYCSSPVGIAGIFLMINMPLFTTTEGAIMLLLIMTIMAISIFVNLGYILPAQFKRLNKEMEEIRKLEEEG